MSAPTSLTRLQELLPQLFQPTHVAGAAYLRLLLTPELPMLLSMDSVQEAILVTADMITPIPNMPSFAIGMLNSRNHVFCVIDLAQMLGLAPLSANLRQYQVVVIDISTTAEGQASKWLGLAVPRVMGVARFQTEQLQVPVGEFPIELAFYLKGSYEIEHESVMVLDAQAIASASILSQNPFVQK